jgi:hypothetical protein
MSLVPLSPSSRHSQLGNQPLNPLSPKRHLDFGDSHSCESPSKRACATTDSVVAEILAGMCTYSPSTASSPVPSDTSSQMNDENVDPVVATAAVALHALATRPATEPAPLEASVVPLRAKRACTQPKSVDTEKTETEKVTTLAKKMKAPKAASQRRTPAPRIGRTIPRMPTRILLDGGETLVWNDGNGKIDSLKYAAAMDRCRFADFVLSHCSPQERIELLTHKYENGNTVLHIAAQKTVSIFRHFLDIYKQKRIDVGTQNEDGDTALHLAAGTEPRIVGVFTKFLDGVSSDKIQAVKNKDGNTPLHIAMERGTPVSVQHLVDSLSEKQAKTILKIKNEKGKIPSEMYNPNDKPKDRSEKLRLLSKISK